eukprot:gnl/Spiro4/10303_TR5489_c0_g1_i1.p3 gnl/Spiro4/10303_TR5489_c0_g1~~gnl/Spiro4/10303_TR5489_c0_g1_i1.p3  ORF type:complete len:692 (-),score=151.51 gnl/Spiro4/10303_TR5489_c0_g1_i1:5761-7836(-)
MAVEKSALRVTELDFFEIRNNLKNFLRSQEEFTDFDFEGSGMSVLLDILAYNTHYMGYYLNMVGNEMFLDTAQLRTSVLSHAKMIGYVPNSNQGALSKINIIVTPSNSEDQDETGLVLERYTRLLGRDIDGINYPFVTLNANTAIKSGGSFAFSNVLIKQGEVVTRQFIMDISNDKRMFVLPSSNVDIDTIRVAVQESVANSDTTIYTRNRDITEIDGDSTVYFLEENENLTYTVQFGDNTLGRRPKDGNVIIITYLDNVGSSANNISKFVFIDPIAQKYSDNVIVDASLSSYGGIEKETIEQTRFRAPLYYSAQNRAVNTNDYETLLLKNYNYIDAVSVWGGEDNDPIIYGKVFASVKTRDNYQLTNFEKERLKEDLIKTRNVVTVTPEIVDPDYVYLSIKTQVTYDPTLTSLSSEEIEQRVRLAIGEYNDNELNKFNSSFKKAVLQKYIENADRSIQSSEISVYVQKQIQMDLIRPKSYTIPFNMKLARSSIDNSITTYPSLELRDPNGISRQAYIEEIPEVLSGISAINIITQGRNYINVPTVTITGDGSGAVARAKIAAGRLTAIEVVNPGQNYSYAIVTITGDNGEGASASVLLQRDIGRLRTVYYNTNGEKIVLKNDIGSVNHKTGLITLNAIRAFGVEDNEFYLDGYLVLTAQSGNENIFPLRNRILSIAVDVPRSVQISAVTM